MGFENDAMEDDWSMRLMRGDVVIQKNPHARKRTTYVWGAVERAGRMPQFTERGTWDEAIAWADRYVAQTDGRILNIDRASPSPTTTEQPAHI
jgi:hypothetical protein